MIVCPPSGLLCINLFMYKLSEQHGGQRDYFSVLIESSAEERKGGLKRLRVEG